jgi:signal transduction histidine kinase
MLLLGGSLGWLAWGLLQRDRDLAAQRLAEKRDIAREQTVAVLEKRFAAVEQDLSRLIVSADALEELRPGDGAVFVRFTSGGASIRTSPADGLLYYPDLMDTDEPSSDLFTVADELEFGKNDHQGSIAALRRLASSADPAVRAAALARIAGSYSSGGQLDEALKVYAKLAELGSIPVGGMPAAYAAQYGALGVLEKRNDPRALADTARQLQLDLQAGRWPVSFATYQTLAEMAQRHLPDQGIPPTRKNALAEAVKQLSTQWSGGATTFKDGRTSIDTTAGPVLLMWRTSGNALAVFAAGADFVDRVWLSELKPQLEERRVHLVLTTLAGNHVFGIPPNGGPRPTTAVVENTWTVQLFNDAADDADWRGRRNLLLAGMAVLGALILAGGAFIGHTVSRELAVARLQSDFVSAVSHEFRTPLTTLCQLSEMLKRGRVTREESRSQYYALLHEESRRLHRLVESLLNFGRLESGKLQFRFEELDAAELLRHSSAEFAETQQARGYRFEVETAGSPMIRADREMLGCVFWNLFENAVKYSPDSQTVWVNLSSKGARVEIAVRDQGIGIPRGEQRRIFEKFVRGSAAQTKEIRGTGIGLAMARQIVRAHGGEITLESEPGKGSTFTVTLPKASHRRDAENAEIAERVSEL